MNKIKIRKSVGKISISDFSKFAKPNQNIDNVLDCKNIYNFKTDNGKLEKGMGIRLLMVRGSDSVKSYQYQLNFNYIAADVLAKVAETGDYNDLKNKKHQLN